MSTLRQAAERALRAMEAIEHKVDSRYFSEEITALCLAIAETEQPERNLELEIALAEKGLGPIAWGIFLEHKGKWGLLQRVYDSEEFAKSSSIGFETGELAVTGGLKFDASQIDVRPLYAAPTPRKPLTDGEIEALWQNTSPYYDHQDFARAIERAHGIGEQHE